MKNEVKNIIKVLIAEDEILVRIGLKMSINWEQHGYNIVGDASDGIEALQLCDQLQPDIVLTDIKMPRMNGLELIKQLNEKHPNIKAIILSNYDEFSYAQQALKLGAVNYILKVDVSPDDLIETLNNVRDKYFKNISYSQSKVRDNSLERYKFIRTLIFGKMSDCEIEHCIKKHQLQLENKNLVLVILKINNYSSKKNDNYYKNSLLNNSVLELIKDCICSEGYGEAIPFADGKFIIILSLPKLRTEREIEEFSQAIVKRITESIKNILGLTVSMGISNVHQSFKDLNQACEEAEYALSMRFFEGQNYILRYKNIEQFDKMDEMPISIDSPKIVAAISENKQEVLNKIIEEAGEFFISNRTQNEKVRFFFSRLIIEYTDFIHATGGDYLKVLGQGENPIEKLIKIETITEIIEYLKLITERLLKYVEQYQSEHKNRIVYKSRKYIAKNYNKDITLTSVAKYLNVNSSYFSKLFKEVTGINFIDYLTRIRVDKAKYYLANTDMKIYQVALTVGYQNAEYFSKLFKQITAMSPKEYRENVGISK